MSFSNFKVGTRLNIGFVILLLITVAVGGIGLVRLSQLDDMVARITNADWNKARLTMETSARNNDNAANFARLLMVDGNSEIAKTLKAKIAKNSEKNAAALAELDKLVALPKAREALDKARAARETYNASRTNVIKLAADPKSHAEAVNLYTTETADLLNPYTDALDELTGIQRDVFDNSGVQSAAAYKSSRNLILTFIGAAVIFGVFLAIMLARSIVKPLANAMSVAEAIRDGQLNNAIDTSGKDETSK